MARMTVKSTYALDPDTVRVLERLAQRWNVSKSEALRRIIRSAAQPHENPNDALLALDELQRSLELSAPDAERWAKAARAERRASSARRDRRS